MSKSETLARYCLELELDAVPEHVRAKAKLCVLDSLGCMIAGAASTLGKTVAGYATECGKPGACTVFGQASRVDIKAATLANATAGHALELDDGHRPSDNHLGCAVVSSAFAAAEQSRASGGEFLKAVIAGYNVMGRVGQAICLPRGGMPFHGTSVTAGFGSAASVGVVLGLSERELTNALGIAGTGAAGLREVTASAAECKPLQVGRGAAGGVDAALLAKAGLPGPAEIFEGRHGFVGAMTSEPRVHLVDAELGTRYVVTDCTFKVHAACGVMFTAIDAALTLRRAHSIDPRHIESVRVALVQRFREDAVFTRRRPPTESAARFSVPFAVAAALSCGEVTIRQMSAAGIRDASLAALEDKIHIIADPRVDEVYDTTKDDEFFFYPASVTVRAGGREYYHLERSPLGYDPRRALSADEVAAKFIANTEEVLGHDAAQRAVAVICALEKVGSMEELQLLRGH